VATLQQHSRKGAAPTLEDVARHAGVSRGTVSMVLNNGRSNTRVSDATRQRILQAVSDLRYSPNAIARSLRRQRTNTIGFYDAQGPNRPTGSFYAQILSGIQSGCLEFRQDLLWHGSFRQGDADDIYAELANGKIDGLVLLAAPGDQLAERLAASHLPVVAIGDAIPSLPSVVADDDGGSRLVARYLAGKGHTNVLYRRLTGADDKEGAKISQVRRWRSFHDEAAKLGMRVRDMMEVHWSGELSPEDFARFAAGPRADRPTAVACVSDYAAYNQLRDCGRAGLRVPEDLAIVGFDGNDQEVDLARFLTTVYAPWERVGERALHKLMMMVGDGEARPEPETVLPVLLIVGDTA